jgi:hypothetical protein
MLEFMKDMVSEDTIIKDLFFDEKTAQNFINLFNIYLKRLNIQLADDDNEITNKDEDDTQDELEKNQNLNENEINKKEIENEEEEKDIDPEN